MSAPKQKAIFLDRDGTINVEKDYVYRIDDFEYLPGAVDSLRILQDEGYLLIIITNQSGIARGYYSKSDFEKLNDWMLEDLRMQGVHIDAVYYCPHHPAAAVEKYRIDCSCRKPKLGLFEQAIKEHNLDLGKSFAIGDKIRDCSICLSTACHGFLIAENEKEEVIEGVKNGEYRNVEYAADLKEAAERIINHFSE